MSKNSYISNLVRSMSKESLVELMERKNIQVKFDKNYAIFNYKVLPRETHPFEEGGELEGTQFDYDKGVEDPSFLEAIGNYYGAKAYASVSNEGVVIVSIPTDYSDPVVQEARGIIVDMESGDVVCWPFRKFGNWQESYADDIDWESAKIFEKVDGSIVKLWFDKKGGDWVWSTNGVIFAENAPVSNSENKSFLTLIKGAINYKSVPFSYLDKDNTYIFELTGKENKVVIDYDLPELYYLGTRSNKDGKESSDDRRLFSGFRKPKEFILRERSLDSVVRLSKTLNKDGKCTNEGFVVVDKHFNRVKVKTDEYFAMHKMASISNRGILKSLMEGVDAKSICEAIPSRSYVVMYYAYKLEELMFIADEVASYTRRLYEEYSYDRKAVYLQMKGHPLCHVGMQSIGNDRQGREIFKGSVAFSKQVERLVPSYEEPEVLNCKPNERKSGEERCEEEECELCR